MTLKSGWIKLSRNFLDFPFYSDRNAVRVYIHLKLSANYEAVQWQGFVLQPGQCVTTLQELSKDLRISVQQARSAIQKLKTAGMLTVSTTNRFSVFSVHDYCVSEILESKNNMQTNRLTNKQITSKKQTENRQITNLLIKERIKEEKNERKQECQTTLLSDEADEFIELDEEEAAKIDENCRQMMAYVGNEEVVNALYYFDENKTKLEVADVSDYLQLCKITDRVGFRSVKSAIDEAIIHKPKHAMSYICEVCGQRI